MARILQRFFEICLLRVGPQGLPDSRFLLGLSLVLYTAAGLMTALPHMAWPSALPMVLLDAGLLAGLLFALLWGFDMVRRYQQTLTALWGTGALLHMIGLPLIMWQHQGLEGDPEALSYGTLVASLLLWVWLVWSLMVIGHILRHAVSTVFPIGVMLALLYLFISFNATRSLFFPAVT